MITPAPSLSRAPSSSVSASPVDRCHRSTAAFRRYGPSFTYKPAAVNSNLCRTGIAYIANVAVRKEERRRGIAKMLVQEAEAERGVGDAGPWHCIVSNIAALRLYKNQGFKCIRVPEADKWPEPKIAKGVQYSFMMKLVPKI
nr:unnamed protein product [Digitaria exilis]